MEDENKEETKIKSEDESNKKKKYKIMKNSSKNYLLNLVSYLINNKNYFEEKLKPNDIEIVLEFDSNTSTIHQLKYKTKINYGSFLPKRDIIKNIKLYKSFPVQIESEDEYYENNNFDNVIVDIFPNIKKNLIIDLSEFPFCSYENEKIKYDIKAEIKSKIDCKINEYILCIYIPDIYRIEDDTFTIIENTIGLELFDKYIKSIFIIIQTENEQSLKKIISNEKIKKYLESNEKNKVKILFNFLSNYKEDEKNQNTLINIFQQKIKNIYYLQLNVDESKRLNYFFILDHNKKVVKIKSVFSMYKIITLLLMRFNQNKKNEETQTYFDKKEKNRKERLISAEALVNFILNFSKLKLNYLFDIIFRVSLTLVPNEELTEIYLTKVNHITLDGKFLTKEYKYLKQLTESIKLPICTFSFKEMPTIDIEIDFTDMKCEKCKNVIQEEDYIYYCYICKMKYCWKCVHNQLENNEGRKRYIDEKHHLLFFKTRDKDKLLNIEKSKLGKNLFSQYTDDKLIPWDTTTCNGCRCNLGDNNSERYICLGCRKGMYLRGGYMDFCSKCIKTMCENKKEMVKLESSSDQVIENWSGNKFLKGLKLKIEHKHEEHIYMMMPYQIRAHDENQYTFF